jgi:UDP-N-acetylglucosamine 2-epimerase (non-hydrolysing)/GDP/UDP-N,N'-diacetylbacillosamine 2-epimerase (hydrolysing)
MKELRRIAVVTGTRADYGLLRGLLACVRDDPDLQLQILATGAHLSPEFGLSYREIEADGFAIDAKIDMLLSSDSPAGVTKSMGVGLIGFADALARLQPDVLVVLGDRFEALVAAQAAAIARIRVAHIHGGETSEGAIDESLRHAISKLAHLHFVAAEPYRRRVIQMGESPAQVFNVGAPGLDGLQGMRWLSGSDLSAVLGLPLKKRPLFLVTYHPATLGDMPPKLAMAELLAGLDRFADAGVVFTYPNADAGGRELIAMINDYVAAHKQRMCAVASLGSMRFLSLMREADVVIGNSSSGLTEAPALKRASVNIGDRQKGRLKAESVIDAAESRDAIAQAITKALSPAFQGGVANTVSLYGEGGASAKIVAQLKAALPPLQKHFHDINHGI